MLIMTTLVTSASLFAEDEMTIAKEKQIQKNIQAKIIEIEKVNTLAELEEVVTEDCYSSLDKIDDEILRASADADCEAKVAELNHIGDVEVAKLIMVNDLQRFQQSAMLMFKLTSMTAEEMSNGYSDAYAMNLILLPFAVVIDVVALPFTFLGSLITGF